MLQSLGKIPNDVGSFLFESFDTSTYKVNRGHRTIITALCVSDPLLMFLRGSNYNYISSSPQNSPEFQIVLIASISVPNLSV